MQRIWIVIPAALAALALLWWSQRTPPADLVSGVVEADDVRVGSRVGGRIATVSVEEGQVVRRGDLLLTLEPFDLEERLSEARQRLAAAEALASKLHSGFRPEEIEQARARRDRLKARLEELVAGPRPLEIAILQDKLDVAQAELRRAEIEYKRVADLVSEDRAKQLELDDATRTRDTWQARFAEARNALALAREGTRPEELAQARAALAEAEQALVMSERGYRVEEQAEADANVGAAQAAVAAIERQLGELQVVAPIDGVVEAVELEPGDLIAPNAPIVSILDPSELRVRAYVPASRLSVKTGDEVAVRVDGFPGRRFRGRFAFVSRESEFTPTNIQTPEERVKQVFRVRIELLEGRDVLRAGMTAEVLLEHAP